MSSIEYTRVLDIFARHFKLENEFQYSTTDNTVERFSVTTRDDGREKVFQIELKEYDMTISFDKDYIDERELEGLVSRFEYDLEQTFYVNIHIEANEALNNYELKIFFG